MDLSQTQSLLGISLPEEYLEFTARFGREGFDFFFRIDNWLFGGLETAVGWTLALREAGGLGPRDFAFAVNAGDQYLFFKDCDESASAVFHLDEDRDVIYYAFSLSEFSNFETTQKLIEEMDKAGFEKQDISQILHCPGSLYQYAFQLRTSPHDDHFSEKRNEKAMEIFLAVAEKGHPLAAHQLADHYYFQEITDADKVIEWRTRAIEMGSADDAYELADFLIDERPEQIDRAISLLESLLEKKWYRDRAMLKISRSLMRGTGGRTDYEKGLRYARESAATGNYNALSDLAFYRYRGIGVEKDIRKAYDLLVQAEEQVTRKTGSGMWDRFIKQLEKEMR